MSKVVGTRVEIKNGNENDIKVTCCMEAEYKIRWLERIEKAVSDIRDSYDTSNYTIKGTAMSLKYCPTCGDRYEKDDKL